MKLIFISITTLVILFGLLMSARMWGLGQHYAPFEHKFFDGHTETLGFRLKEIGEATPFLEAHPDLVLWLDVRFSGDKKFYVLNPEMDRFFLKSLEERQKANPQTPIFKSGKLQDYTVEEIQAVLPQALPLVDYLEKYPTQRFIFNIGDNVSEIHSYMARFIDEHKLVDRVLVQSPIDVVLSATKELRPEFLYGTSQSELMRLLAFESMWVLPAAPLKGDVLVSPFTLLDRPAFTDQGLGEFTRRNKKAALLIDNLDEYVRAKNLAVDLIIASRVDLLPPILDQRSAP